MVLTTAINTHKLEIIIPSFSIIIGRRTGNTFAKIQSIGCVYKAATATGFLNS